MQHGDLTESNALGELGIGALVLSKGKSRASDTERSVVHRKSTSVDNVSAKRLVLMESETWT